MSYEDHAYYKSEIGFIRIEGGPEGITLIEFDEEKQESPGKSRGKPYRSISDCIIQLEEYFKGERKEFDLDLRIEGTAFQKSVWKALLDIPYGKTVSYGHIAGKIGKSKAARAVGNANSKNRFVVVIPCHRVIGAGGGLVGYAKGLYRKEWLLNHERKFL
jgi:methylated-DNA-[protein]-cysteine S-methyltransferase